MGASLLFHTLVRLVDAEDFSNENTHAADRPLEINDVASRLETQRVFYENYPPNSAIMFTQTADATIEIKHQFRTYCSFCKKSNHSVSNCFPKK